MSEHAREALTPAIAALRDASATAPYTLTHEAALGISLDLAPEAHDERMGELLGVMEKNGIGSALRVAENHGPHIVDDFHRLLVQYLREGHTAKGLAEKDPLWKPLHMTLFEVAIPEAGSEKDKERPLKEVLSSMEQLLSGLLAAGDEHGIGKDFFTLEIAVSNKGQEIIFYASVLRSKKDVLEKQVRALFPKARISERKNDYNIFTPEGVTVASRATLTKNHAYPLRTYDAFDADPLSSILAAMGGMAEEGEGAAIQISVASAGNYYNSVYKKALDKMATGESAKKALDVPEDTIGHIALIVRELFSAPGKKKKEAITPSPVDQISTEQIGKKIASPIALANLRLIASAGSERRAETILKNMEAAFEQFTEGHGNSLLFKRAKRKEHAGLLQSFAFRSFVRDDALKLNLKELATLYHLSATKAGSSRELKKARAKEAPAPLYVPKEGVLLGQNSYGGETIDIRMAPEDRLRHLYLVGQTGTGKSNLLKNLAIQDILRGEGMCMIDPHGADILDILSAVPAEREKDLIYFDPSDIERPLGLNMLEYDPRFPEQRTFIVNELLAIFNKLFDMKTAGGPGFEQYFRNSALLVMEHPESGSTLFDIGRVLGDSAYRRMKLSHSKSGPVVQFWENAEKTSGEHSLSNWVNYVTNKFDAFTTNEFMRLIVGQERSAFNFREVMDTKKILLVNLGKGRLGELNAYLLGLLVVGKILMAALSRGPQGSQFPPFYLYIDEFQNITTDSTVAILSEARKFGLSLTIAHQFIKQIPENIRDAIFGNVGSLCAFRVGADDGDYLAKQFAPVYEQSDFVNLDNYNAYLRLLIHGKPASPFNITTLPAQKGNAARLEHLRTLSRERFGRPRGEVEQEIQARYTP